MQILNYIVTNNTYTDKLLGCKINQKQQYIQPKYLISSQGQEFRTQQMTT